MKPLTPWVIAEVSGKIISAHCDCMAGLGESCSHVASLLWAIESGVRIRDSMTVTEKKSYWVLPAGVKEVPYAPVKSIDFVGKKRSFAALHSLDFRHSTSPTPSSSSTCRSASRSPTPVPILKPPTQEEVTGFFSELATCSTKPAILSLVEPHSSSYIPISLDEGLPPCVSELFKPEYLKLSYGELIKLAEDCMITVKSEAIVCAEEKTRLQSKSMVWFNMRTGRITASCFHRAARTNTASPSISLIISVCYPEKMKFKSASTCWGCEHEDIARTKYKSFSILAHHNFEVRKCGFFY